MNIIQKIKEMPIHIKYMIEGTKLEKLNKNVQMMTLDEINAELLKKISSINKINELNGRTEELITYILEKIGHDNQSKTDFLCRILNEIKDDNLKIEIFDKFANHLDKEVLKNYYKFSNIFSKNIDNDSKLKKEERRNRLKTTINYIIKKISKKQNQNTLRRSRNRFQLQTKNDEYERFKTENKEYIDLVYAKAIAKNYKKIDILDLNPQEVPDSNIVNILYELPDECKKVFISEYLNSRNNFYINEEEEKSLKDFLKNNFSRDELVEKIIENDNQIYKILEEDIKINCADIQNYYRKNGKMPISYDYMGILNEQLDIKTYEEVIKELKYFKEEQQKGQFLNIVSYKLPLEELDKVTKDNEISERLKKSIYIVILKQKNINERLEIFKTLSDNLKEELMYSFINKYELKKYAKEEIDNYINELINNIENEQILNDYKIATVEQTGNYREVLEIIRQGKYSSKFYNWSNTIMLNFSDEELREIYEKTEDNGLRSNLLTLTRRKDPQSTYSFKQLDGETLTNKQIKEYNEKHSKFILVNNENYADFIKMSKSYHELMTLLSFTFNDYARNLSFEKNIEIYKCFENTYNQTNKKDEELKRGYERLKDWIINNIININEKITIDDIKRYSIEIEQIEDIYIKEKIWIKIIQQYYRGENLLTRSKEEVNIENKTKSENLENLYEELLNNDKISITNKYFYLSMYMSEYYNICNPQEEIYEKFKDLFEKLNNEAGMSEYTKIFDLAPQYETETIFGEERTINKVKYRNIGECIKNLNSDIIYEKLKKLYEHNHNIKNCINELLLDERIIELLDDDIIDFISRYSINGSEFEKVIQDEKKSLIFTQLYNRLKNIKIYSEEDSIKIAKFTIELSENELKNIDNIDENKLDLLISIALSSKEQSLFKKIQADEKTDKTEKYIEYKKENARKKIQGKLISEIQALDAIGSRFFNLSYNEMKQLVTKYSSDVKDLIRKYEEKELQQGLNEEEQNELVALKIIRNLKEIMQIKDKKALVETFKELEKLPEYQDIDFSLSFALEENIKRVYAKDYKENIYQLKESDKLDKKVDGITVYSPKKFNMLVHVVAAYGNFKLVDKEHPEKSAKELWRNIDNKENHILCTSLIGNSNLCYARIMENDKDKDEKQAKSRVIMGFANFDESSILTAAPYDIAIDTKNISSDKSYYKSVFRKAKNMIKNTRWYHNEVDIERRIKNKKEENIEPDYIVCFDEINEESKKVAKDFGIPIVLINSEEIAINESENISNLIENFMENIEPSKISEILNLYQTNMNSFANFKSELVNKYFNPEQMNEKFENIFKIVENKYNNGEKEVVAKCYKELYEAFQNEIDLNLENGIDPENSSNYKFNIRRFAQLAEQKFNETKQDLSNVSKTKMDAYKIKDTSRESKVFDIVSRARERNGDNNGREEK